MTNQQMFRTSAMFVAVGLAIVNIAQHQVIDELYNREDLSAQVQAAIIKGQDPNEARLQKFADIIEQKYKVDRQLAYQVVTAADKQAQEDFPKLEDILALVAIESEFKPKAKSQLAYDPAFGLTQVRPKVWNIDKSELETVDGSIKHGVAILTQYYQQVRNKDNALQAYNVGITAYQQGTRNPAYVYKHKQAKSDFIKVATK